MIKRVQELLKTAALAKDEAIILHKPSNIFYLTGYTGEGLLVVGENLCAIVTDFRYTEQAAQQAPDSRAYEVSKDVSHDQVAAKILAECGIKKLRFEDDAVTVKMMQSLKKAMPEMTFVPLNGLPEMQRRIKDAGEVALIREACDISCKAFEYILGFIKPGLTERQVQISLDYKMLELGGEGLAFNTIVAAGAHGSLPHAIPGDRVIADGDMLTMDFGAKKGGYCADMTRTVAVGKPSDKMREVYQVVLDAQMAAQDALKAGMVCSDVDAIARDMIYGAGYEGCFGHGLGHAVGIDIHENPRLSMTCNDIVKVGHVLTVEPGIYLPGVGGVRIENSCIVTENGAETLVYAPKELLIL